MKPLRPVLFAAVTPLLLGGRPALAGAEEITPVFQPPSLFARVGQPVELKLPPRLAEPIAPRDIRMVVRSYGAQELIEPQTGEKGGPLAWRWTPRRTGACIVATAIEPSSVAAGERTFRYEKLFLRAESGDPTAAPVMRPSASTIARFAQRLELCPMVDPLCLLIGADLPVRVKFDGADLKGATVAAKVEPAGGGPSTTLTFITNDSAAVNVPVTTPGLWMVAIEYRPEAGDQGKSDRFVATMMFVVEEAGAMQAGLDRGRSRTPAANKGGTAGGFRPKSRNSTAIGPAWEQWGPAPTVSDSEYAGRVSVIVCSPSNSNKYYVGGADGGVWRTTDGGASWTPLTDDMPTTAMGALALDPTNENVIYVGTGEANFAYHCRFGLGILKSTDGGDTWTALAESTFAGRCISRILVDPSNPQAVYAAVTPAGGFIPPRGAAKGHPQANDPVGVYKSLDGGVTWARLTNGLPSMAATDLAMQPGSSQIVYAAIGHIFGDITNGIYKSTNAGQSWTKLAGGFPTTDLGRISIAIAPSMPQRVFAAIAGAATSTGDSADLRGVYRTDNGGTTWTAVSPINYMATYGWYLNVVTVQPSNPNVVIVGGMNMLRSTNAGSTWTDITPPHVDQHALFWDAAGRLLAGDDGGVHRSTNLGDAWTALNDGLGIFQFYAGLSLHPTQTDTLFGGTQDNGTNRRTGSDNWTQVFGGDGGFTAVNQASPDIVFCEYQGTGNLYRS
ncbi:MAG TPA: DUF4198 domain-containing protein, partial [Phycisphaerae bacterium]|nr:DUF4198 domain-containing protein [Phycisphaerae bacterium]